MFVFRTQYTFRKKHLIVLIPLAFLAATLFISSFWIMALIFNIPLIIAILLHKYYRITKEGELNVYRFLGLRKEVIRLVDVKGYAFYKYKHHNTVQLITISEKKIKVRTYEMDNFQDFFLVVCAKKTRLGNYEFEYLLKNELLEALLMSLLLSVLSGVLTIGAFYEGDVKWYVFLFLLFMWSLVGFYLYEMIQAFIKYRIYKKEE